MDELIDGLQAVAKEAEPLEKSGFKKLNNKWAARSGLQKAIRRGRVDEALICGANLVTEDIAGAWRALSTIIVEDVGIADPDLLTYGAVAGLQAVQKKVGGKPSSLFMGMVIRACNVPVKTRSACELSLGADKDPEMDWKHLHSLTDNELMKTVAEGGLTVQYAATCVAKQRCRKDKTGELQNRVLQIMMDSLGTSGRARAAMMSFERPVDTMNLAVWPLLLHKYDQSDATPRKDLMPHCPQIGGVMAAAWDMHVSQGKKAIKAFHTSLVNKGDKVMEELAAKSEDVIKALGSIIFIIEGGQVAPERLWSAKHEALKEYQDRNFSAAWGCPPDLYEAVTSTVRENFELLNSKREWAVKS